MILIDALSNSITICVALDNEVSGLDCVHNGLCTISVHLETQTDAISISAASGDDRVVYNKYSRLS